ncbi:DNA cytosine methyltransferase [bacterium]|nr:DNA cytosine methyltransferase [bacterium]
MRVADFFCGGGGFSEGFRQAGFDIVFAVDKWEPAVTTYKGNKPYVNVIKDDVVRIANLPDYEFEALVPDCEIIVGSPPCQSFSHSNKSGNADKSLGIKLIEAYLKIIARKKFKKDPVLRYWVLENVPAVKDYIKDEYTAADFGMEGEFVLKTNSDASGKYNAKYFGAPTNRERFLCGEFPIPVATNNDDNLVTLQQVLDSLGDPLRTDNSLITDINYPDLKLESQNVTDQHYIYKLADFEYVTAKRLKQDKGYMGKMSFPENTSKPARTVMATMSCSSRESMILSCESGGYRLPTVREVASMMSFPIDYWFYGKSKATKHTLVGNAVPPKMSYAIALAIAKAEGLQIPLSYPRIKHDDSIDFYNLNGEVFPIKEERSRRAVAKFKYHIPYLIVDSYRVELTNYHSDFENKQFKWDSEIHYSQGKDKAKIYTPKIYTNDLPSQYLDDISNFIIENRAKIQGADEFQKAYCMTTKERNEISYLGPYELLGNIKNFIDEKIDAETKKQSLFIKDEPQVLPLVIVVGYFILSHIINK